MADIDRQQIRATLEGKHSPIDHFAAYARTSALALLDLLEQTERERDALKGQAASYHAERCITIVLEREKKELREQVARLTEERDALKDEATTFLVQVARLTVERDRAKGERKTWITTADEQRTKREAAEAQVARLTAERDDADGHRIRLAELLLAAEAQVLLLARTLREYGAHKTGCSMNAARVAVPTECVCGLGEVLASLPKHETVIVDPSQMSVEALQSGASEEQADGRS